METAQSGVSGPAMKLLFVEMGVVYDQHGQDVTAAAMRACRDAISSNSIPAFQLCGLGDCSYAGSEQKRGFFGPYCIPAMRAWVAGTKLCLEDYDCTYWMKIELPSLNTTLPKPRMNEIERLSGGFDDYEFF